MNVMWRVYIGRAIFSGNLNGPDFFQKGNNAFMNDSMYTLRKNNHGLNLLKAHSIKTDHHQSKKIEQLIVQTSCS